MTELLGPLAWQRSLTGEARGSVAFSIEDLEPAREKSVLPLCQGKLRCKLDIDHGADAAVELKEGGCFLSGQDSAKDRRIALTQFCLFDVRVQPAANKIVGLVIGQGSVFVRIFFDNRGSRFVDLSHIRRVLFVHLPELCRFAIGERHIRSNELLLDRAYIPA